MVSPLAEDDEDEDEEAEDSDSSEEQDSEVRQEVLRRLRATLDENSEEEDE